MSHTSALGMDDETGGQVAIIRIADRIFSEGVPVNWPSGLGVSHVWRCGNGTSTWVHTVDDHVECFVPLLDVVRKTRLRVKGFYEDPCRHCSGLICENVGAEGQDGVTPFPLAVQLADFVLSQPQVSEGAVVEMALGAVAEGVDIFADETAFERAQRDGGGARPGGGLLGWFRRWRGRKQRAEGPIMAARSFIPSGLFPSERGVQPNAVISGVVRSATQRPPVPQVGKVPWVHVELETLDMVLDCALDVRDAKRLRAGAIVSGSFWMVAEGSRTWPTGAPPLPA